MRLPTIDETVISRPNAPKTTKEAVAQRLKEISSKVPGFQLLVSKMFSAQVRQIVDSFSLSNLQATTIGAIVMIFV